MPLYCNGVIVKHVTYNGVEAKDVTFRGVNIHHVYTWDKYSIIAKHAENDGSSSRILLSPIDNVKIIPAGSTPPMTNTGFDFTGGTYTRISNYRAYGQLPANESGIVTGNVSSAQRYAFSIDDVTVFAGYAILDNVEFRKFVPDQKHIYQGTVTDNDINAYPADGVQGDYWYVLHT